jgi:hypothetical protein
LFLAVGIAWIPVSAHCDLDLTVSIDIPRRDTDVVAQLVAFLAFMKSMEEVFLPGGILIPEEVALVREEDVLIPVAVDIPDGEAIANGNLGVDGLGFKLDFSREQGSAA